MRVRAILIVLVLLGGFRLGADELNPPFQRYAVEKVHSVYDGDTATLDLTLAGDPRMGLRSVLRADVRLFGIDTPEIRPLKTRVAATEARDYFRNRLEDCPMLEVVTGTDSKGMAQRDKYGRLLVSLECVGDSVAEEMIRYGYGKPYFGGSR